MGCSFRFAGNPVRTKEHRIERLTVNIAPRAARAKEKRAGLGTDPFRPLCPATAALTLTASPKLIPTIS